MSKMVIILDYFFEKKSVFWKALEVLGVPLHTLLGPLLGGLQAF